MKSILALVDELLDKGRADMDDLLDLRLLVMELDRRAEELMQEVWPK